MNNYKAASERTDADERALTPPFRKIAPARAQHSPLTWHVADEQILSDKLNDYGNFNVCIVKRYGELTAQDRENMKLIVRACNNAQRLADALKRLSSAVEALEGQEIEYRLAIELSNAAGAGRVALAQWEGGAQ